ncbi:MAG: transposase [Candidatus Electryonea clarkiae]|nr:transposase [Candidatus Electryonea clarkiae]MDP8286587.1 transposase [Candidatus Electryonea clarkiae]
MARIARIVVPHLPHHIIQRGNRRMQVFFDDDDYQLYIDLIEEWCAKHKVEIWAYCLMPNHIHLVAVPATVDGLRLSIGEAHRRYTRHINFREKWRGHLWQERFASFPMDERYLLAAVRYVELNPVRAGLVKKAKQWRWSSAKAHLNGQDDALAKVKPMLELVDDWNSYLNDKPTEQELDQIQLHSRTGRPLGSTDFLEKLEKKLKRNLKKKRPGRKKRNQK